MTETSAKIVADSVSPWGDRVTSFEITFHRFTLAEFNTHAIFARNSASSRAIPVSKQLDRYVFEPAYPLSWPAEQKGMSGGAELEGQDLYDAEGLFITIHQITATAVKHYMEKHSDAEHRLHKSVLNRILEPLQWHTALVTATSYENFFDLRVSPNAQPEIRAVAELMKDEYRGSAPVALKEGSWHLPYIREDDPQIDGYDLREISAARCARLSYLTQNGRRDYIEDIRLYKSLVSSGHWSPLEHVCVPYKWNRQTVGFLDPDTHAYLPAREVPKIGKFIGWLQWRHVVEARAGVNTYR